MLVFSLTSCTIFGGCGNPRGGESACDALRVNSIGWRVINRLGKTRGPEDGWLQKCEAVLCEKVQVTIPLQLHHCHLELEPQVRRCWREKSNCIFLGRLLMPVSTCGQGPLAKPWRARPFASSFSTPAPCCFLPTVW